MTQVAILPVETVNRMLNYMASQPYSQVADIIAEVQSKVKLQDIPEAKSTKTEEVLA